MSPIDLCQRSTVGDETGWQMNPFNCKAPVIESPFHIQVSIPNCPANLIADASGVQTHQHQRKRNTEIGLKRYLKEILYVTVS